MLEFAGVQLRANATIKEGTLDKPNRCELNLWQRITSKQLCIAYSPIRCPFVFIIISV